MNIGIDFGTTNSIISYNLNNKIKILEINNKMLIPSQILITKEKILYGLQIEKKHNGLFINNFKNDILKNNIIEYENKKYNLNELIKEYIKYLIKLIKENIYSQEYNCVISVPNNFDDLKKKFIKNIIINQDIKINRIINEATSAAISYTLNNSKKDYEKILIIDIGGGTTDITILEKDEELFEVNEAFGDSNLGGNNFTKNIINDIQKKNNNTNDLNLWDKAEELKKKLMNNSYVNTYIKEKNYNLTQELMKEISTKTLEKLTNLYKKINIKDIKKIILVGGSSNLKIIKDLTQSFFKKEIIINDNLQTIVSKGCCELSMYLNKKNNELIIIDVVKLSIGIETSDDNYSIIIPKGTIIPTKISKKYIINNTNDLNLNIFQGNRLIAKNNILITTIKLNKKDHNQNDIIEITINIDSNELLDITIKNLNNNKLIKTKINKYSVDVKEIDQSDKNEIDIYLKNKIKFEIKNIIKNYLKLIKNNLKIIDFNKKTIKKNLNDIENNLNKYSYQELINLKKKLYKKFSFQKI